ncbi:MAG TPA: hypothetical protein VMU21_12150 [Thermodesulfovibrionales bacterium]|nr:hypothetical protein [Thermodesulfovibrionales bacterium]
MGTLEIIKKFIESNWIIERGAREVLERLPVRLRYGISYGPTFRSWLGFLKESEQWNEDRLEAYQVEQLRDLLMHAGGNVPYYRKLFGEYGFKPERTQSLDDLKVLPYTDKEIVRDNIEGFLAENVPRKSLFRKATSGSTGIPLALYSDKAAEEKHWATVVHAWSKVGYTPGSRILTIWGNITRGGKDNLPFKRYANQLIISHHYFDSERWIKQYLLMIRQFRPEIIFSLPSTLSSFSNYINEGLIPPLDGIKACIVVNEALYSWQRKLIEENLNTRVFSTYGMVEKNVYASGCVSSSRYHVYPQYGVPEVFQVGDGIFEIVGTGLINYAQPLVRYRTFDRGVLNATKCPACNSLYKSLNLIEGRLGEVLIDKNGKIHTPIDVGVDSKAFEDIKLFQFYQDTPGKILLRLVKKRACSDSIAIRINEELMTVLGLWGKENKMEIEIVFVDEVNRSPSGKFTIVEQKLDVRRFLNTKEVTASCASHG